MQECLKTLDMKHEVGNLHRPMYGDVAPTHEQNMTQSERKSAGTLLPAREKGRWGSEGGGGAGVCAVC